MGLALSEYEAWVGGFEFLQMLRLRIQLESDRGAEHPNRLKLATSTTSTGASSRRRSASRMLQQRLQLDYER